MSRNASSSTVALSGCLTLKQRAAFLVQRRQQFVQRMSEGGDAIGQELFCDCSEVNTQLGQPSQCLLGILLSRFEGWLHLAVITEGIQRRGWNDIDGVRSDQFF